MLPAKTASLLKSLTHRFGTTMTLVEVDCLLRELVYEMPFAAEGISVVSQRVFTIFAPPQHAMAQLGLGRHPGADKPGTVRTADLSVGLAVVITEGDLEDRMRNAFDVLDTTGIGRVNKEFVTNLLRILSKQVIGDEVINPFVDTMFIRCLPQTPLASNLEAESVVFGSGDVDWDGTISFVEFWQFANTNVEVGSAEPGAPPDPIHPGGVQLDGLLRPPPRRDAWRRPARIPLHEATPQATAAVEAFARARRDHGCSGMRASMSLSA